MRCPECGTVYDEDGDNTVCCPACGDFGMFGDDTSDADEENDGVESPPHVERPDAGPARLPDKNIPF